MRIQIKYNSFPNSVSFQISVVFLNPCFYFSYDVRRVEQYGTSSKYSSHVLTTYPQSSPRPPPPHLFSFFQSSLTIPWRLHDSCTRKKFSPRKRTFAWVVVTFLSWCNIFRSEPSTYSNLCWTESPERKGHGHEIRNILPNWQFS